MQTTDLVLKDANMEQYQFFKPERKQPKNEITIFCKLQSKNLDIMKGEETGKIPKKC